MNTLKLFLIFSVVLLVCLMSSMGSMDGDSQGSVNAAMSFVQGKGFSISAPEYNQGIQGVRGKDGVLYNGAGLVGNMIYVPPAFAAAAIHVLRGDASKPYFPLQADYLDNFLSSFIAPLFGFFLVVSLYKTFNIFLKRQSTSLLLALAVFFSTNLFPLSKHPMYQVPFACFVSISFYFIVKFLSKRKESPWDLVWSGVFAGLGLLSYNLVGLLVFGACFTLLLYGLYRKTRSIRATLLQPLFWLVPFILSIGVMLLYNYQRFGNFFSNGYDPTSYDLTAKGILLEGVWGQLLSPGKSIFVYSPLLVLATYIAFKKLRTSIYAQFFIVSLGALVLFYSRFVFWHGDMGWGPRYLSVLIPFGGIVLAAHWRSVHKVALGLLVAIGLFVQLEGATIPYQIQYGPYDMSILKDSYPVQRDGIFQYYNIGQFFPRYSPVNKYKKEVFKRAAMLKHIFFTYNPLEFVYRASVPYIGPSGDWYRNVFSSYLMYAFEDLNVHTLDIDIRAVNQPITHLQVCTVEECRVATVSAHGTVVHADFETPLELTKGTYVELIFNDEYKNGLNPFKLDIYGMKVNDRELSIRSYRRLSTDNSFIRPEQLPIAIDYNNIPMLWDLRSEVQEMLNITPDYWWAKAQIYYNIPNEIRYASYVMVGLIVVISGAIVVLSIPQGNSSRSRKSVVEKKRKRY